MQPCRALGANGWLFDLRLSGSSLLTFGVASPAEFLGGCCRDGAGCCCADSVRGGHPLSYRPAFPQNSISVTCDEFNAALDHLAESGVPLKPDRDQAWTDFAS